MEKRTQARELAAKAGRAREKERDEKCARIGAAMQLDTFAKALGGPAPSTIYLPSSFRFATPPAPCPEPGTSRHFSQTQSN